MTKITVTLTEQQEQFLKVFADKQFPGAEDNLHTVNPIHIVRSKYYEYIPYHKDLTDYFIDLPLAYTSDDDYDDWYDSEVEMIREYYEYLEEDCPEVQPFEMAQYTNITSPDGEEIFVEDFDDYFGAYGCKVTAIAWRKEEWQPVAYFFIRSEAEKYLAYQKHNLNTPMIYTSSAGYDNRGDFHHFWELLMGLGIQLNADSEDDSDGQKSEG